MQKEGPRHSPKGVGSRKGRRLTYPSPASVLRRGFEWRERCANSRTRWIRTLCELIKLARDAGFSHGRQANVASRTIPLTLGTLTPTEYWLNLVLLRWRRDVIKGLELERKEVGGRERKAGEVVLDLGCIMSTTLLALARAKYPIRQYVAMEHEQVALIIAERVVRLLVANHIARGRATQRAPVGRETAEPR